MEPPSRRPERVVDTDVTAASKTNTVPSRSSEAGDFVHRVRRRSFSETPRDDRGEASEERHESFTVYTYNEHTSKHKSTPCPPIVLSEEEARRMLAWRDGDEDGEAASVLSRPLSAEAVLRREITSRSVGEVSVRGLFWTDQNRDEKHSGQRSDAIERTGKPSGGKVGTELITQELKHPDETRKQSPRRERS